MTRRACVVAALVFSVGQVLGRAQQVAAPSGPSVTLAGLEAQALASHPAVREAASRMDEARARARQAGAWQNPLVGVAFDELRPRETPSGFISGTILQTIPLGGKLAAAQAEAERELARREADLATARQRVLSSVRTQFYEVLGAEERVRVTERLANLSNEVVEITRQLFNVGSVDRPDVLAAEVEAKRLGLDLTRARTAADTAWQLLATASGQSSLTRGPLTPTLDAALPTLDRQASLERVLRESPELQASMRAVDRERAGIDTARRVTRPDLFLRGEVGWNKERVVDGPPLQSIGPQFGVEAGVSLPLFNKNRGGIAAATAATSSAEAAVADLRLALEARFATAFGEYELGRTTVQTYRAEILPRAQQSYELYLAKYRQMAAAYPQVLVTQRNLFELTREYVEALDQTWRAAVQIQGLLVGGNRSEPMGGSR